MTLASFRKRLRDEHRFLVAMNQPATWQDVICIVPDWHHKYAEALLGVYDA